MCNLGQSPLTNMEKNLDDFEKYLIIKNVQIPTILNQMLVGTSIECFPDAVVINI